MGKTGQTTVSFEEAQMLAIELRTAQAAIFELQARIETGNRMLSNMARLLCAIAKERQDGGEPYLKVRADTIDSLPETGNVQQAPVVLLERHARGIPDAVAVGEVGVVEEEVKYVTITYYPDEDSRHAAHGEAREATAAPPEARSVVPDLKPGEEAHRVPGTRKVIVLPGRGTQN